MTTPALEPIFTDWQNLNKRRRDIQRDPALSMIGKKQALERLDTQRAELRAASLEAVQKADKELRAAYMANKKARGAAINSSLSRWGKEGLDFPIQNEIERAKRLLARGVESEIRSAWNEVKDSGAMVYAWNCAFDEIGASDDKSRSVRLEVKAEYKDLFKGTPEFERVEAKGSEITQRAEALRADIISMMSVMGGGVFDSSVAELKTIMSRLHLARRNERGEDVITFQYIDAPADGFAELSVEESTFGRRRYEPAK